MAVRFDKELQYQFVLLFARPMPPSEKLKELPRIISKQLPSGKSLGLKLGEREQGLLADGENITPMPSIIWRAGGTIWRLQWMPTRIDLVFDARGYQDIAQQDIPLKTAMERVCPNVAETLSYLEHPVNRIALNFTGQSACEGTRPATEIVARRFFNSEILDKVHDKRSIQDLLGRVNDLAELKMPGVNNEKNDVAVQVNRIESGAAQWKLEDGVVRTYLDWRFDFNTSPVDGLKVTFGKEAVTPFFDAAERWISEETKKLDEISG